MSHQDEQDTPRKKYAYRWGPAEEDPRRSRRGIRRGFDSKGRVSCQSCFDLGLKIDDLRLEVVRLKAALKHAQKTTQKDVFNAHMPSSKIAYKKNSEAEQANKKGGAKTGHVGHGRQCADTESADRIIELPRPAECPECRCGLNQKDLRERTILETMPVKAERVLYRCSRGVCPKCFKVYSSKPTALPKTLYGNRLVAQAATMHFYHGISIGKILSILGDQVTEGGLIDAFHRLGGMCQSALPKLIESYRKSEVMHADETGWRTDGHSGYAWLFCSPETSIFEFQNTRSARVARKILGEQPLPGILVVDRYGGYNKMPCRLQYCYAHLLREVEKLEDEFSDNAEVQVFVSQMATALAQAMKLRNLPISDEQYYETAKQLQAQIEALAAAPANHLGIKRIQEIFLDKRHRLYQWVKNRNIPAENNRAERELRPTVIARKVSFGSQSEQGAKTRSAIMSVLFTAKKRFKQTPLEDWLKQALDQIALQPNFDLHSLLSSTPSN